MTIKAANAKSTTRTAAFYTTALLLSVMLAGCFGRTIEFNGESTVDENGTLRRTARYIPCGSCSEEEFAEQYDLPAGGAWRVEVRTGVNPKSGKEFEWERLIYELLAEYGRGEKIPTDFVRKGRIEKAYNDIKLTTVNLFFIRTYHYQESFQDTLTQDTVRAATQRAYDMYLDFLAQVIAHESEGRLNAESARRQLTTVTAPLYASFVAAMEEHGWDYGEADDVESHEFLMIFEDEELFAAKIAAAVEDERLAASLTPEEWQEVMNKASESNFAEEKVEENQEEIDAMLEQLFGPHGFVLFDHFPFTVKVSLPGVIYQSNATTTEDDVLIWEFTFREFVLNDYTILAHSRIVYRERIIAAAVILIIILLSGAMAYAWQRRQKAVY